MKTKSITSLVLVALIMLSLLIPLLTIQVSANEIEPITNTESENNYTDYTKDTVPNVTLDDAEQKIEGKMWNIVELLKTIGKPICIIGFIIAILSAVFGALGKKGPTGGLIGAFVAAVAYVCINYSSEIVLFIQTYLVN